MLGIYKSRQFKKLYQSFATWRSYSLLQSVMDVNRFRITRIKEILSSLPIHNNVQKNHPFKKIQNYHRKNDDNHQENLLIRLNNATGKHVNDNRNMRSSLHEDNIFSSYDSTRHCNNQFETNPENPVAFIKEFETLPPTNKAPALVSKSSS